jgi:hypothetical protein
MNQIICDRTHIVNIFSTYTNGQCLRKYYSKLGCFILILKRSLRKKSIVYKYLLYNNECSTKKRHIYFVIHLYFIFLTLVVIYFYILHYEVCKILV